MILKKNQASSTKRPARKKTSVLGVVVLLMLVLASASAWWFLRSRSSARLTTSASSQNEKLNDGDDDGQLVKKGGDGYRHRDRSVEPDLTDDEFREKMLARDKEMRQSRRAEMREMRDKLTLKDRRDTYGNRKQELQELIAARGKGKRDKNPRSIVNDAIRQLRELESDEDAPY